jgi:hypothetical protein
MDAAETFLVKFCDQINENETDGSCSEHEGDKKYTRNFSTKT